jgi:hypothetical protein
MAGSRFFRMSRHDRRWVTLAAGLLAVWLQILAPFALVAGMQTGMARSASAAEAAADAVIYLCQPLSQNHGKDGPVGKHLLRIDCQICQTLHLLANGLVPAPVAPQLAAAPTAIFAPAIDRLQLAAATPVGFSSRAPPAA